MGRTNPTYRNFLERQGQAWRDFRRALRHQYTQDYDRLFEYAEHYADAASFCNQSNPETTVLLSMLLGVEAERRRLEGRVAQLEADPDDDSGGDCAGHKESDADS